MLPSFLIGIVTGLRSLTAPAAVSCAAFLGWINLDGSPLAFMGTPLAAGIFLLLAVLELFGDKMPKTPARTTPAPLIARLLMGGLSGACLPVAAGGSLAVGGALGAAGAVMGTFGGYQARTRLVKALAVKDVFIAVPEDVVTIVCAYILVSM